jgi:hypothetical protein
MRMVRFPHNNIIPQPVSRCQDNGSLTFSGNSVRIELERLFTMNEGEFRMTREQKIERIVELLRGAGAEAMEIIRVLKGDP